MAAGRPGRPGGPSASARPRTRLSRLLQAQHGFTTVEVLVAYSVLLSVSMVVLGSSLTAMKSVLHSKRTTAAIQIANQQLEKARTLPFDNVGTQTPQGLQGNPAGSIVTPQTVDGYSVSTRIRWLYYSGRRAYKSINVTVDSTLGAVSVSAATIVFGRSYIVNSGDIRVTVVDRDTGLPLPGAPVTVEESGTGSSVSDTADESGQATFSGLAIGTWNPDAASTGYLPPATGTVAGVSVAPDQLSDCTVQLQRPSVMRLHVVDDSTTAVGDATIFLSGPYGYSGTLATDAQGWAEFQSLYVGTYSYSIGKALYSTVTGTADVTAGATTVTIDPVRMGRAGDLSIQVNDENGVAVPGATVWVAGPTPSTTQVVGSPFTANSSGQVNVSGLSSGNYGITAGKTGYATGNTTGTVVSGQSTSVTVVLSRNPYGDLLIRVTRNGQPRTNYRVRLVGQGINTVYRTDANGEVLVTNLLPGPYRIYAPYNGSTYWNAVVTAGQQTIVVIQN